jgi:hypothetical protein
MKYTNKNALYLGACLAILLFGESIIEWLVNMLSA